MELGHGQAVSKEDWQVIGLAMPAFLILALSFTMLFPWSRFLTMNYFLVSAQETVLAAALSLITAGIVFGIMSISIFKRFEEQLVKRRFLYYAISAALFLGSLALMLATTSFNLFSYFEMNTVLYSAAHLILLAPLVSLTSLLVLGAVQSVRSAGASSAGAGGMFAGLFSLGCPMCGSLIYSLVGITAGLSLFPLKGLELKFLSIGLLGVAAVTMKRQGTCRLPPGRVRKATQAARAPDKRNKEGNP